MNRQMREVSVITREGMIWIEQGNSPEEPATVIIAADQVPLLVKWLQEAEAEVQAGSTVSAREP